MKGLSARDIAAIREGIRQQERSKWEEERFREDFDARMARVSPDPGALMLIAAGNLSIGDTLVSVEDGRSFYRSETLTRVVQINDGAVWIEWGGLEDPNGGAPGLAVMLVAGEGGGQQIREGELVLIERKR